MDVIDAPKVPAGMSRVCIDFDGVMAENVWPIAGIGKPLALGIALARHYFELGFEVIVYTSRPASHADAIRRWLDDHGLGPIVYDVICDKPLAGIYIDDRAWNPYAEPTSDGPSAPSTEPSDFEKWEVIG